MNSKSQILFPLFIAIALAGGIFLGMSLSSSNPDNPIVFRGNNKDKISKVLRYVESEYVDSVDMDAQVEKVIQDFLQDLDPHSYYISGSERAEFSEPLQGNFDGIGVEFRIVKDTVRVINPISGGPSEKVGVRAGDCIVAVEDSSIAGIDISNKRVMELLRGERGTKVRVTVKRKASKENLKFTITRDAIPITSVPIWLKTDERTGYLRISRFGRTTHDEFKEALREMGPSVNRLVIDLRGNGGGYLQTAIQLAEEFLPNNKLIVYTEGRNQPRQVYETSRDGRLDAIELVFLINEGSASASEILAGAMQDHDRATIIGRRSFGKGLVQNEIAFDDNSAMRLTIARYYTPSGRSIQRPYGDGVDYSNDYFERLERGEMLSADSISFPDSLRYTTAGGRTVYGGGGIMPDIFIAIDTMENSRFLTEMIYNGIITQFSFGYADKRRAELQAMGGPQTFAEKFKVDEALFQELLDYAEENELSPTLGELKHSGDDLRMRLRANIARVIWGEKGYYTVFLPEDKEYKAALQHFDTSTKQ